MRRCAEPGGHRQGIEQEDLGDSRPPEAKPDEVGARVGRATVLHLEALERGEVEVAADYSGNLYLHLRGRADDIEQVEGGKTFFWRGYYEYDLNQAHTEDTQLGVFGEFEPKLSDASRDASRGSSRHAQSAVTAIGYHRAGATALTDRPPATSSSASAPFWGL